MSNASMLQDWLLQERVIAQRLREKSDEQARIIGDLRGWLRVEKMLTGRLTKKLERLEEEIEDRVLEEILDVLEKENPNIAR